MQNSIAAALSLAGLIWAGPAAALTADLSSTILSLEAVSGDQTGFFLPGDTIDIHFELDDAVIDSDADAGEGLFADAILDLTVTFGNGLVFGIGPGTGNDVLTRDELMVAPGVSLDSITLSGNANPSGEIDGIPMFQLTVIAAAFGAGSQDLVVDEAVGMPPLSFQELVITVVTFDGVNDPIATLINGTASVPEPGAAALVILSLGALGAGRLGRRG